MIYKRAKLRSKLKIQDFPKKNHFKTFTNVTENLETGSTIPQWVYCIVQKFLKN